MTTFSALLGLCAGNSPGTGEFPSQRPVTRSFDVSFDLRVNKRLSKRSRRRWFETPSRSQWRHCNLNVLAGFLMLTFTTTEIETAVSIFADYFFQMHLLSEDGWILIKFHWDVFLWVNLKTTLNWWTNGMTLAEDKPSSEPMRTNVYDAIRHH